MIYKIINGLCPDIPAQLASFPKAQPLGRLAIYTNIISSLVEKIFIYFSLYLYLIAERDFVLK